jgi:hypothetical protein
MLNHSVYRETEMLMIMLRAHFLKKIAYSEKNLELLREVNSKLDKINESMDKLEVIKLEQ